MIGKTLAHYTILEKLGSGGMGEVYRARDNKLNRDVALKVLLPAMAGDPERRSRFQREAQAVAALKHPNIVMIHSVEEADGILFFTMELVEGHSLSELIPKDGFPLDKLFDLAIPLADAVAGAHARSITHRDLKPANIMFDEEGRLKVLDFGLAKLLEPLPAEDGATIAATHPDTQDGRILGTVAYMSPEQAEGKSVDHRSDIFSVGIILHEMVTGTRPFQGETNISTLSSILKDTPSSVTDLKPSLPRHLARIIHRCLSKDPERRYQSMKEVRNELEQLRQEVNSGEMVTTGQSVLDMQAAATRKPDSSISAILTGPAPLWKKPAFLAGLVLAILLAGFGLPRLFRGDTGLVPQASASATSIAVFSFENLKDPSDPDRLGQILQELVITDLSTHPTLGILSSQRLYDVHRQIAGGGAPRIDRSNYTEVATRAGATAMLTGTLSQLGDRWILATQIVDLDSGKVTSSERLDGEDLYRMVDDLTRRIYAGLAPQAEPTRDLAVAEQTSASLPAYQRYLEGIELLSRREYPQAEEAFEAALALDPAFGKAQLQLAIARWWAKDDNAEAADLLRVLVDGDLKLSERDLMLARGMLPVVDGRYSDGQRVLKKMTELYPDDKDAWYGLGEAMYHSTPPDMEGAIAALSRALELDPSFLPAFTHLQSNFALERRYAEAIRRYRGLLRGDPDHTVWYAPLLAALLAHGEDEEAQSLLREGLNRFPGGEDRAALWSAMAAAYGQVGNPVRRLECLEEAMAIHPSSAETMLGIGQAYREMDRVAEATAWFDRAWEADEDPSIRKQVLNNRILVALGEGRANDAVTLVKEQLEPLAAAQSDEGGFSFALGIMARLLAGQEAEAARVLESRLDAMDAIGARQGLLSWVAWAYSTAGQTERALELTRRGMTMEGGNEIAWLADDLAGFLIRLGRYDEAEAGARRTLELSPRQLRGGEESLVQLAMLRGNPEEAEERLRVILDEGPVRTDFKMALAFALSAQGRHEEAEEAARWAFDRNPGEANHGYLAWVLIAGDLDVDEGIALAEKALPMPRAVFRASRLRAFPYLASKEHALGLGYLKKKRYADAVRLLEQAAKFQPGSKLIEAHLAEARRSI